MMKECVVCKTCKKDFDEPYINCAPCRKKLALKAKQYRLIHGPEINARRLGKRSKGSGNYKYQDRRKPMRDYPPKTCLHCAKTFQPSKSNWRVAKYCNPLCRSRKDTEENKKLRWEARPTIKCRECGIAAKPKKIDGVTCGKRQCVDESRRKTKLENDAKARQKGGHRYERYREYQNQYSVKWAKEKYATDSKYNIAARMRGALRHALKGLRKNTPTFALLGYTKEELVLHLESLFDKPKWNGYQWVDDIVDLSWDNMSEWHIDHIRPVASFNYDSTEHPDFKKCWALNNLQPYGASDNMSKGDKWDGIINR